MRWHERMNSEREARSWSFGELARRSGVDEESLKKYAQGKVANPRGTTLLDIAKAFGWSEERLVYGIDDTQPATPPVRAVDGSRVRLHMVRQEVERVLDELRDTKASNATIADAIAGRLDRFLDRPS